MNIDNLTETSIWILLNRMPTLKTIALHLGIRLVIHLLQTQNLGTYIIRGKDC